MKEPLANATFEYCLHILNADKGLKAHRWEGGVAAEGLLVYPQWEYIISIFLRFRQSVAHFLLFFMKTENFFYYFI